MHKHFIHLLTVILIATVFFVACQPQKPEKRPVKPRTTVSEEIVLNASLTPSDVSAESSIKMSSAKIPLIISVKNLRSATAPVEMSIYIRANKFPDENSAFKKYRFKPKNGKLDVKIKDLTYGEFALALYQDENSDGQINKNLLGIPEEPYAFSNNYKPVVKAPSFDDCSFKYNSKSNQVTVFLIQ